jgi:hypothetical protein
MASTSVRLGVYDEREHAADQGYGYGDERHVPSVPTLTVA